MSSRLILSGRVQDVSGYCFLGRSGLGYFNNKNLTKTNKKVIDPMSKTSKLYDIIYLLRFSCKKLL